MSEIGDRERARLETLFGLDEVTQFDVRPTVGAKRSGLPGWAFALGVVAAAVLLFSLLDIRRTRLAEPAVRMPVASSRQGAAEMPPLNIPPPPAAPLAPGVFPPPVVASGSTVATGAPAYRQPLPQRGGMQDPMEGRLIVPNAPSPPAWNPPSQSYPPPPTNIAERALPSEDHAGVAARAAGPILVIDVDASDTAAEADPVPVGSHARTSATAAPPLPTGPGASSAQSANSARTGNITNRAATIPQGTLIPAVLETAFDSTNPGFARAVVSRNIKGFDGSRILIPRGSRLVGEYKSETSSGQRRALINWAQLIRPDGVVVQLDSPAADPLGRGGIPARVSSNGFGRFIGTLLQSTLDIGRTIVAQRVGGTVLLAYPGAIAGFSQATPPQLSRDQPRLRVDPGTSISVFVARDLVFSSPEKK